jgi:hypothetical protein
MSKTVATFIAVVLVVIALHAFRAMQQTNITGKVISDAKNVCVYLINGNDSLKTRVNAGHFKLTVKPGSWKVLIDDNKMMIDEGLVEVREGSTLDLGIIRLN